VQVMRSQVEIINFYIRGGDFAAADVAFEKLLTVFAEQPTLPKEIYQVAGRYDELKKYDKARQLYQYNVEHFPDYNDVQVMWSQVEIIKSHIRDANEPAADAAFNKLLAVFSQQPTISKEIYEVANAYSKAGRYEKANRLYKHVVEHWPGSTGEMWAKMDLAKTDIGLGNYTAADKTIDILIADFNDNPELPTAIFMLGEEYYNLAFRHENEGRDTEAKEHFRKALAIWERIVTELPESDATATAHAYYFSAGCYRKLGKYEKAVEHFQTVVDTWPNYQYAWSAQCLIGECYEKLRDSGAISEAEANPLIEQAYQAVIEKYPDCSLVGHACLKLGDMYLQKGSRDEAVACLELFLAKAHPDDPRREMVKARFEKLGGYNK